MSKKKKPKKNNQDKIINKIILITVLTELVQALVELVDKLTD